MRLCTAYTTHMRPPKKPQRYNYNPHMRSICELRRNPPPGDPPMPASETDYNPHMRSICELRMRLVQWGSICELWKHMTCHCDQSPPPPRYQVPLQHGGKGGILPSVGPVHSTEVLGLIPVQVEQPRHGPQVVLLGRAVLTPGGGGGCQHILRICHAYALPVAGDTCA